MTLFVVGADHRRSPFEILERLAVAPGDLGDAAVAVRDSTGADEVAVLSTCNRVEVYVSGEHATIRPPLIAWLAARSGLPVADVERSVAIRADRDAVTHLFAVTSGLRSAVLGERQIAAQVRGAVRAARQAGTVGKVLNRLFDTAVKTSRRIRREIPVDDDVRSIADLAFDPVVAGRRHGQHVLVLGAGRLGTLVTAAARARGAASVSVWNRDARRAQRLAERAGAIAVPTGGLQVALRQASYIVCCTAATSPVLTAEMLREAVRSRPGDRTILDLSVPHNVDRGCADVPDVDLHHVGDVLEAADEDELVDALVSGERIVRQEAETFLFWLRALAADAEVTAMRARAHAVRRSELERFLQQVPDLPPRDRERLELMTHRVVQKLLHAPTLALQRGAASAPLPIADVTSTPHVTAEVTR